jgi:5'-nucleotidase
MWPRRLYLVPLAIGLAASAWSQSVVTFLHTNDLHAHADPTKVKGVALGGYTRQASLILRLKEGESNPVLLNAGDTFQGTLFFNVYEGLADLQFMNLVGYQAMAVGNHEFDRGPVTLGTFARNARFPILAANLDVSAEPALAGLVHPSAVVMAGTEKLGVVGAVTPDVTNISSPGPKVKTKDLVSSVQAEVDKFHTQGIKKVVLLSHCGQIVRQPADGGQVDAPVADTQ